MSAYAFTFQGKPYTPNGTIHDVIGAEPDHVDHHNREVEQAEIAWLKTAPDRVFLYVKHPSKDLQQRAETELGTNATSDYAHAWKITTWPGTVVATHTIVGRAYKVPAFGWPSTRRSVECRIFGVRYVGTYFESSGDYCRLRKAKRQ